MGDNLHYHLFSHIEDRVFDHILQGKYVDLARMITDSDLGDDREQRMEMVNNGGHAYWVPASKPGKKIDDYNTWLKAFRCFSGVLCTKYPHLAVPMIKSLARLLKGTGGVRCTPMTTVQEENFQEA